MYATRDSTVPEFVWEVQPAAAQWLHSAVAAFADENSLVGALATALHERTGTRLVDWLDHLAYDGTSLGASPAELRSVGYAAESCEDQVWRHAQGMFPPVLTNASRAGVALRCDSVEAGLERLPVAIGLRRRKLGPGTTLPAGSPLRVVSLDPQADVQVWLVERHGCARFVSQPPSTDQLEAASRHAVAFGSRQRAFDGLDQGFAHARNLFAAASADLGTAWACDLFFAAERAYWQSRNQAGRVQYERQQQLGLGWANHDHHTYRSSRAGFVPLIATLEQMGFVGRERFYAGREAGWGAQVLEQPESGVVIFADVDLSPDEVAGDFAHEPLAERDELGTVGLWCALHGEAFFEAGMHHLECQFDFNAARRQLAERGVETMAPFTNLPFLKQAFTKGEVWQVDMQRIERLLAQGCITPEQAEHFCREGALGSHLEILERNEGYKGFNQTGISEIITRTDPRRAM